MLGLPPLSQSEADGQGRHLARDAVQVLPEEAGSGGLAALLACLDGQAVRAEASRPPAWDLAQLQQQAEEFVGLRRRRSHAAEQLVRM